MRQEWYLEHYDLPAGQKRRVRCCAETKDAIVYSSVSGISLHCFRCGAREYKPRLLPPKLYTKDAGKSILVDAPSCPIEDYPHVCAFIWAKGGFRASEVGIRFIPRSNRILIPIYDTHGNIVSEMYRAIDPDDKPKYICKPGVSLSGVVYKSPLAVDNPTVIIITEDVFSANRVSIGTFLGCAWLTDAVKQQKLAALVNLWYELDKPQVITWMDSDKAGVNAALGIRKALRRYGITAHNIVTEKDPKMQTDRTIREEVSKCLST